MTNCFRHPIGALIGINVDFGRMANSLVFDSRVHIGKLAMSTGLAVFDTTIQQSNAWLKDIQSRLKPCDRQEAYAALRAVLHVLRDRLPLEGVLGLSAQLPLLLRGMFLEGWRPGDGPTGIRQPLTFAEAVEPLLSPAFPREAMAAVRAVFEVMIERLDAGEVTKLIAYLPAPLRPLWEPQPWPA